MEIQGLIFDFDGIIVDTEYAKYLSWQKVFENFGVELSFSFLESIVGYEDGPDPVIPHLEGLIKKSVDKEKILTNVRKRFEDQINKIELRKGIDQYFKDARSNKLSMAIASNAKRSNIMPLINRLGIGNFFKCILTKEDVSKSKPDPEIMNLAASKLCLKPAEIVVFEDSNAGLKAAKKANIFCVGVPNEVTKHFNLDAADLIIDSFENYSLSELLLTIESNFP